MPAAMLDTLRCAQSLKEAGFTQQQADGTARVLGDALAGVATKEDLAATKKDLDIRFQALDRQLKFVLVLLGLLFAMSAYNFLQPGPVAAPAHAEAPQGPTPAEDQASQAAPAEPNRTLPIKPPKDTAPG